MIETVAALSGGTQLQRAQITNGTLTASIISHGAAVQNLTIANYDQPLVLGFDSPLDYPKHSPYFGAIAGRVANRIAAGRFTLNGETFALDPNENNRTTLHGGSNGVSQRNWQFVSAKPDEAVLEIVDQGAITGFPGDCRIRCTYSITSGNALRIELHAEADQPTPCNLAHHSYFNLDGGQTILDHKLAIHADHYLPVDRDHIPAGEITPVEQTQFDFRQERTIASGSHTAYDHNFCLARERRDLTEIARARGSDGRMTMTVFSTEPGVQFYAGGGLEVAIPGLGGRRYGKYSGFCLEPQNWPDAPNQPAFSQSMAEPGKPCRQLTEYRFELIREG